jgi:hypothetical protein
VRDGQRVVCDPSFLATRTGRVWVERSVDAGCGGQLAAPAAYFDGPDERSRGFFARRPRSYIWGDERPDIHILNDAFAVDEVSMRLLTSDQVALAQIWLALLEGSSIVCRRAQALDRFVAAGAELVTQADSGAILVANVPVPLPLAEALVRRTRFYCRLDRELPDRPRLDVRDLGAWDRRR